MAHRFAPTAAACLLAVSTLGAAALELPFETRDSRFGRDTLVHDGISGRDWLRLDVTFGLSYNEVWAGTADRFAGFAVAQTSDVATLMTDMGLPTFASNDGQTVQSPSFVAAAAGFLTALGAVSHAPGVTAQGFADWGAPWDPAGGSMAGFHLEAFQAWTTEGHAVWQPDVVTFYKPTPYADTGTWLVATSAVVPEPSAAWLLAVGLGALGRLKRRRQAANTRRISAP